MLTNTIAIFETKLWIASQLDLYNLIDINSTSPSWNKFAKAFHKDIRLVNFKTVLGSNTHGIKTGIISKLNPQ